MQTIYWQRVIWCVPTKKKSRLMIDLILLHKENSMSIENNAVPETKQPADETAQQDENNKASLPTLNKTLPPESSRDPLRILKEIAADKDIDTVTKNWLFEYAVTRFNNRRKMAYMSLLTILVFLGFLVLGALHDGMASCVVDKSCIGVLESISKIEKLLVWIGGFLAAIVATYYGVSSFRPSS